MCKVNKWTMMYIRINCALTPISQTAEQFAKTINKLKGKVTMLFITHQVPHGLHVDEVLNFSGIKNANKKNNESHNHLNTEK